MPKVEHTNYATEVGGDCSNRDTALRDEEGHGEQQEGVGNNIGEKFLAVGDDGHRRRHHRQLSRSRSMSPSRGEKIDRRQIGAVNSRGAPSLVARASRNVVRTSAARASAADAAMSDCHAPAVENAPIVATGATSAADDYREPGKCASPQDEGDRGIGPSAAGARERLAGVPQQAIRRDLGSILHKTGGTGFDHARSDGAIPSDVATAGGAAPALRQSAGKKTMKAGATKNIKVVVRRWLGNKTSLSRLYVPMDMASELMPPLPPLSVCGNSKKEIRNDQRGGEGQSGGRFAGKGAGGAVSNAAAASNFSRMTVTFAVMAEAGPLRVGTGSGAPVVDNASSGLAFANNTSSVPAFASNTNSGPVANNTSRFPADDDADLEQPTEGGEEELATSATNYDVEYERRHFGDQVHHRLTKGWKTLCLALKAGVGDTLEMTRYCSRGDFDHKGDQNSEVTGVDHGDEDAGPAAGSSSTIFVRVVN